MNLSLLKLKKLIGKSGQGSLIAVALGGVLLSTLVASATSWYITMRKNIGNTEDKLEAQTIAQSEWERLSHMSLEELETKRGELAEKYSAGSDSQYQISVNLGEKGTFNNGTCGDIGSDGYTNCFKDTTITVYRDGSRMFTTRTLPLMAGDYTRKEIDDLLANIKNDYTNKYNTLANRLNGKEFVKNKTTNYALNLRYEKKAGEDKFTLHAYNGNTEIDFGGKNSHKGLDYSKKENWGYSGNTFSYTKIATADGVLCGYIGVGGEMSMNINNVLLFESSRDDISSISHPISKGDIITIRAEQTYFPQGPSVADLFFIPYK